MTRAMRFFANFRRKKRSEKSGREKRGSRVFFGRRSEYKSETDRAAKAQCYQHFSTDSHLDSIESRSLEMSQKALFVFVFLMLVVFLSRDVNAGSKKVVIHVPYHVKNHKHTHTIYKIIKHEHKKKGHEDWKKDPASDLGAHYRVY